MFEVFRDEWRLRNNQGLERSGWDLALELSDFGQFLVCVDVDVYVYVRLCARRTQHVADPGRSANSGPLRRRRSPGRDRLHLRFVRVVHRAPRGRKHGRRRGRWTVDDDVDAPVVLLGC